MATAAKACAARDRHAATLKKTTESISSLTSSACQSTIAVYSSQLETNWSAYTEAFDEHEKAIAGKDDELLTTITAEYGILHASFVKARISLGKLASPAAGANSSFLDVSVNNNATGQKTAKLPVCKLPTFSGDRTAWVEFKATVRTMLTEQVAEIQRLQCLKEALVGEPRELIAHVLPSDGAFEKAMLLLKKEYENARAIVNESLRRFFAISRNESNKESIATIRSVVNTIRSVTTTLTGCDVDVSTWDSILIFYTTQLLHPTTVTAWEESLSGTTTIPALTKYLDFLSSRVSILLSAETFNKSHGVLNDSYTKPTTHRSVHGQSEIDDNARVFYTLRLDYKCVLCQGNHFVSRCDKLNRMTVEERREQVQKHGLCYNCLQNHHVASCPFNATCKKCSKAHHTLLHSNHAARVLVTQENDAPVEEALEYDPRNDFDALAAASEAHFYHINVKSTTILATALVPVRWNGRSILLNALVDQGATTNLISERACQMLQLPFSQLTVAMTSIGNASVGHAIGKTMSTIGSCHDQVFSRNISALVVKHVAELSPLNCDANVKWSYLNNLLLANPNFTRTSKIDLLLGAEVYAEILLGQIIKGGPNEPIAQQTKLGWIVFGSATVNNDVAMMCHALQQPHSDNEPDVDWSQLSKRSLAFERFDHHKTAQASHHSMIMNFDGATKASLVLPPIPIQIARWIGLSTDVTCVEIHGFCDASSHVYTAIVYINIKYRDEHCVSNILASRTKLAPTNSVSISRLQVCGAVLLSKLLLQCTRALPLIDVRTFAWSDSTVLLNWIAAGSNCWSTFVADRGSQIQRAMPAINWHHNSSQVDRGDSASRGAAICELAIELLPTVE